VRLAQQVQEVGIPTPSDQTPDAEASDDDAIATQAAGDKVAPAAANDDADPDTDRPLVTH
jgi:hypothetical protein